MTVVQTSGNTSVSIHPNSTASDRQPGPNKQEEVHKIDDMCEQSCLWG